MKLGQEDKDLLNGSKGEVAAKLMNLLVKMGEVRGAEEMVDVYSVHTSTMILEHTGYPGIEFMEEVRDAGVKFKVLTTVDPISIDTEDWASLGTPKEYAELQMRSVRAFGECGGVGCYTCTPWVCGNVPRLGQHVAWVETSAVCYANSILGARTNRHADPGALAAAICGKTPKYGFHLDENRRGEILVEVKTDLAQTIDYTALGAYAASKYGSKVYVFEGIPKDVSMESLTRMSSAMSMVGRVAMYHIVGLTPEARTREEAFQGNKIQGHLIVGRKELNSIYKQFPREQQGKRLVLIGCPHCTFEDMRYVAELVHGKKVHEDVALWVLTSRMVKNFAHDNGWVQTIEQAGGKVIADMCQSSPPIKIQQFASVAVDSIKPAISGRTKGRGMTLVSTKECIDIAVKGK